MRRRYLLVTLPLLAMSAPVWGQANRSEYCPQEFYDNLANDSAILICNITVIGNLPTSDGELTENVVSVELPASISGRVEQALSTLPSLQQFRRSDARSASPTSQGVTLRGLGGNASSRALLFLDDVPQADPFGGWVSWPSYDSLNLESIRVRKGGGQPSVGPGALAGVIELDSTQGRSVSEIAAAYGSRDSFEARGRFSEKLGVGGVSASANFARGEGFIPIISSQRGEADRAAHYEQAGLALRAESYINDTIQIQTSLRGFTDTRDRGLDFSENRNSGVDASLRLVQRHGKWQWSATAYLQIREFSSEFGAVSATRSTVTPTLDQFATPSMGRGLRFEVRPPLGDNAELRIGGEWRRTSGETKEKFTFVAGLPTRLRTAGGLSDGYGLFAEGSLKASDALTLSAGGRLDRWAVRDGFRKEVNIGGTVRSDDRFAKRSGTEATGRVGASLALSDAWRIKSSAYTGWRLPTLNELYRPFRVGADATAANEQLSPERIKGVEASLSFGEDREQRADLTFFYNRLDNAIANVSIGQGPGVFPGVGFVAAGGTYRQRQNLDAIVSKGVEIDARIPITYELALRLAYSYVDAKVRGSGVSAGLNGLRPAQVAQHSGNASLDYGSDDGVWQASLLVRTIGRQFEDDGNIRSLARAVTADAMVHHRLGNGLALELRGENLFDDRIEAAISSAGIIERASPRTIWLGVRWNFN